VGEYRNYVQLLETKEGWQSAYSILDSAGKLALPDILQGLEDPSWQIRKWCTALLDHHADQRCIEPLLRRLHDSHADVRRHAVHSIGCQPCKGDSICVDIVSFLIDRVLNDESIRVRRSAAHMLGNQPFDIRALEILQSIVEKETDSKLLFNANWAFIQQIKRSAQ